MVRIISNDDFLAHRRHWFRRWRFARAFLGLAGTLGIDDAPFAGAAAQGRRLELAEGEFDLVPYITDEFVRVGPQGDDVGLLGFEIVFRFALGG